MGKAAEIQLDRAGDVILRLELSDDGKHLLITRLKHDPITGENEVVPFGAEISSNGKALLSKLKITRPIIGDNGTRFGYEKLVSTAGDLSKVSQFQIKVNPPVALEMLFGESINVGNIIISSEDISVQQNPMQRIIPTEIRLAVNSCLPRLGTDIAQHVDDMIKPKTDLHTHFSAIMTADILIGGIKEKNKNGEAIEYPVEFLQQAGIRPEDMKIYFVDNPLLGSAEDQYQAFLKTCQTNLAQATFDITGMVRPEYEGNEQNNQNLAKLKDILHIPADKTIIFNDMEKFYEYRDLLVKDRRLFPYFLRKIAEDYQKQGLKYAEISFSKVSDPRWLRIIEGIAPEIEKETGVQFRFLGTIARTSSKEERESQIAMYQEVATKSPYVLGIDLLAAEINSTYDVFPELISLCEWAGVNYPGMVVRIHAGETSYHPENIAGVVDLARRYPNLHFRVGHGIYGVHDDVIAEMKKLPNIIPEINMASNVALNMNGDIAHHTLFKYIENGIPVVLGSDGHGLYQTEATDLVKLIYYVKGINIPQYTSDLERVEESHIRFVNRAFPERIYLFLKQFVLAATNIGQQEAILKELCRSSEDAATVKALFSRLANVESMKPGELLTTEGTPTALASELIDFYEKIKKTSQFDKVWQEIYKGYDDFKSKLEREGKRRADANETMKRENKVMVSKFCSENNIVLLHDSIHPIGSVWPDLSGLENKTPVMINGIVYEENVKGREQYLLEISAVVNSLLQAMESSQFYFATTGTDIGVQKVVHLLVSEYNAKHPERAFDLAAFVPTNAKTSELFSQFTHVVMVDDIHNIYNMYEYIDKKVREEGHGLRLVTIGGNMWNKDVIQVVDNALRAPSQTQALDNRKDQLFLFNQAAGAAADKSQELPSTYSISYLREILPRIVPDLSQEEARGLFYTNLAALSVAGTDGIRDIYGKEYASSAKELAAKAMRAFGGNVGDGVTEALLEEYFSFRMSRKLIEATSLFEIMKGNSTLKANVMRLSNEFALPEEVLEGGGKFNSAAYVNMSEEDWDDLGLTEEEIEAIRTQQQLKRGFADEPIKEALTSDEDMEPSEEKQLTSSKDTRGSR